MQTELWMGISYREQARLIGTLNQLQRAHRLTDPGNQSDRAAQVPPETAARTAKRYHEIELIPVEIAMQRGFFTYFVEDPEVFEDARSHSLRLFLDGDE